MKAKKRMFLVFSHQLSNKQIEDSSKNLNVDEYIYMPNELQKVWSNIPPDKHSISEEVNKIIDWLENEIDPTDIVLVQGDFGATFKIVSYLKSKGIKTIYSTTEREAYEKEIGEGKVSLRHVFSHVIFREY